MLIYTHTSFFNTSQPKNQGKLRYIASYLYKNMEPPKTALVWPTPAITENISLAFKKNSSKNNIKSSNKIEKITNEIAPKLSNLKAIHPHKSSSLPQPILTDKIDSLLALLHTAIQNQQQYPLSALRMKRQGTVKVQFKLYPSGVITDLHLIHSCGTASLDEAALNAVRLAAPFELVSNYLTAPQVLSINIIFVLDAEND